MSQEKSPTPAQHQEDKYRLPYHWFPEDRLPRHTRQEKERILRALIERHAPSVRRYLDVGCGDGRWTSDLLQCLGADVEACGTDISERAIAFARLISPQVDFEVFDGQRLPFADQSFDLVTSIEVIEHIEAEEEALHLRETKRVLRPGGLLVLTTPSQLLPLPPHHLRHYTIERLTGLLQECGFEVCEVRGQMTPAWSRFSRWRKIMNRFPFLWMPWRRTVRETVPERALDLLVAARSPSSASHASVTP